MPGILKRNRLDTLYQNLSQSDMPVCVNHPKLIINMNSEQVNASAPTDCNDRLGRAYSAGMTILDGLSGKDRLKLLKALASSSGHRVLPGLGTWSPAQSVGVPMVGKRPKAAEQPKSTKSALQKRLDSEIKEVILQIKEKSVREKRRLPQEDPLIKKRYQLFREKHEREGQLLPPHSGGSN
jgi:hypothetical protein